MLWFKMELLFQKNKQKVQRKFSEVLILPLAGLEEGTSKPIWHCLNSIWDALDHPKF